MNFFTEFLGYTVILVTLLNGKSVSTIFLGIRKLVLCSEEKNRMTPFHFNFQNLKN